MNIIMYGKPPVPLVGWHLCRVDIIEYINVGTVRNASWVIAVGVNYNKLTELSNVKKSVGDWSSVVGVSRNNTIAT